MFSGLLVALATPFHNGSIDVKKIRELVRFQLENGVRGLVPCGTTGESPTLSHDEHKKVIEIVIKETGGAVPVLAGAGSNSTAETIDMCQFARKAGADGVLLVVPYYNRPTPEGLFLHFSSVAKAVDIPIVLYNIPSRSGVNLMPSTVIRLVMECKNIVGIKEASGSIGQASEIIRGLGENFDLLSGDDAMTLPLMSIGGKGVISVAGNIIPRDIGEMIDQWNRGQTVVARQIHLRMLPLIKTLFVETNPGPLKEAMGMLGICSPEVRLPLAPMNGDNKAKLAQAMKEYGLKI